MVNIQKSHRKSSAGQSHKFSKFLRGDTQNKFENKKKRLSWVEGAINS